MLRRSSEDSAAPVSAGAAGVAAMNDMQDKSRSNIRLALILGVVAFGFFLLGLYLAMGKAG